MAQIVRAVQSLPFLVGGDDAVEARHYDFVVCHDEVCAGDIAGHVDKARIDTELAAIAALPKGEQEGVRDGLERDESRHHHYVFYNETRPVDELLAEIAQHESDERAEPTTEVVGAVGAIV